MSKAQQIREVLQQLGPNEVMSAADVAQKTGIEGIHPHLSSMVRSCEVISRKLDGVKMYRLDPDYVSPRQRTLERQLPIKRKSKRAKGSKKKHGKAPRQAVRTMKDIVAKHVPESRTEALARIALQNLIASAEGLAATVRETVDGIENNPALRSQIEASERATQLARLV